MNNTFDFDHWVAQQDTNAQFRMTDAGPEWISPVSIDGRSIPTNYIRIENLDQFRTTPPIIRPDAPGYLDYWSLQTKRCIEGMWGQMFGKWRYMRGNLYFYMNFTVIEQTDRNKETMYLRPIISDLEWELSYGIMVARGFSGFTRDPKYTSLTVVPIYLKKFGTAAGTAYLKKNYPEAFNEDGELLEYMDPLENCRRLHDAPIGRPLFLNPTSNFMPFGSRGGGKSYYIGLGEIEHGLLFDGATAYNEKFRTNKLTASFCVGSGDAEKSSEFCKKLEASISTLAHPDEGKQFGVWGRPSKDKKKSADYAPCPLFRHFKGTLDVSNKTNPYEYWYETNENGSTVDKGTRTKLFHVNYSTGKARDRGAQAAAGGRYLLSVVEEAGLCENLIDVHTSNESTISREGRRFGCEIYIGTSGNAKTVHAARKMFLNPQDYNILSYPNLFGTEGRDGRIGFFIPFYMTLRQYKDKDGNTDYFQAANHVEDVRAELNLSTDPQPLLDERMNRPCFVEEMWLTPGGSIMPVAELAQVETYLLEGGRYKTIGTSVKLIWDPKELSGVRYEVDHAAEPYTEWPLDFGKRKMPTGCPVIYQQPVVINGVIPNDLYTYVGHDPYVEEDITKGGSVGVTYIMANSKYLPLGYEGNVIVASYIDKPLDGLDRYYENQEKLIALYGNPKRSLWFESNRGADCRSHYIKYGKTDLLALTPQLVQGSNVFQKTINSFGYHTGSQMFQKVQMAKWIRDFLLRKTTFLDPQGFGNDEEKMNLERIPCIFLIRQLINYNLEGNFDAVDGFRGCVVGLMNDEIQSRAEHNKTNFLDGMMDAYLKNPKIFNSHSHGQNQRHQGKLRGQVHKSNRGFFTA